MAMPSTKEVLYVRLDALRKDAHWRKKKLAVTYFYIEKLVLRGKNQLEEINNRDEITSQ